MSWAIGEVARRAGCSVPTIRYYEEIGLLARARRAANGRRSYGHPDLSRIRFIRRSRDFGMSIKEIRELLNAETTLGGACEPAKTIVAARLADVARKRDELAKLHASLATMLARCEIECGPTTDCCTIFEDMRPGSDPHVTG
jgi:MerR family copper efflux transcriptional regulator